MSEARKYAGPWLDASVLKGLPQARRDFDQNRDPLIARQLADLMKREAERREDQAGRGAAMVKQDKPAPAPHPTGPLGEAVDRQSFNGRWLAEQRDAAFAQAKARREVPVPAREQNRNPPKRSR